LNSQIVESYFTSLCLTYCLIDVKQYFAGQLLELLNVSYDANVLPTTYGELRPPLGIHRIKVDTNHISCELNL